MKLVEEFTMRAGLSAPLPVGEGPIGTRVVYPVGEGEIEGERLKAKVVTGGEWALIGPDGFLRVDVRLNAETHDGAHLYIQYTGLLEMSEKFQSAMASGEGTQFEDQYFYTNPKIECGDPRYAWLNQTFFIGQGRLTADPGVEYRVWRPA